MSRLGVMARAVLDEALVGKIREGRLRDEGHWPYGLRAVVAIGCLLFGLTGLVALISAPIRSWSSLSVPNTLTSSVPDNVVWLMIFLLGFCLALFVTAAIHGPWWLRALGLLVLVLLLGIWSFGTVPTKGIGPPLVLAAATTVTVVALMVARGRRELAWWEFPVVWGLIGLVLAFCTLDLGQTGRKLGFRMAPVFADQTLSLLTYIVLPAAFAAGAAVAEIAVSVAMVTTKATQRRAGGQWPYIVLGVAVALRLVQEAVRLADFDPVNSGWVAMLPAIGLVLAFAGLGWLVSRLAPSSMEDVAVGELPDDLGRVAVGVGAAVIALMLPVYVFIFGFQIVVSVNPAHAPAGFDPTLWVNRMVDGFRVVVGIIVLVVGLRQAKRGRPAVALVLGGSGIMLIALALRLLTGYRWAFWLDPDALVSVVTAGIVVVTGVLLVRRQLSYDRALGLASVLALAILVSMRSVVNDPVAALIGTSGVAFILFGVTWDFLTNSDWANTDGRRLRRPVRVLLALGYPLLTITVVASDALIRRPRTFSDLNAFAELGELILGTALLAAATTVVLAAVRANREVV